MRARPRLVLIHGTRFDSHAWEGYAELIPEADVATVDLPGHGSRAGEPYSTEAALTIVEEVTDTPAAVVLAGHSLGGYIAAAYAHRHPERLAALVLIGATADPSRHPVLVGTYTGFARLLPIVGADRMARVANLTLRGLGMQRSALPDATGYAVTPQAWASVVAEATPRQLSAVTCPVFLAAGQFDQMRVDIRRYARACRDPRVRILPRASHLAPLTHPVAVAAVLREAVAVASLPQPA